MITGQQSEMLNEIRDDMEGMLLMWDISPETSQRGGEGTLEVVYEAQIEAVIRTKQLMANQDEPS